MKLHQNFFFLTWTKRRLLIVVAVAWYMAYGSTFLILQRTVPIEVRKIVTLNVRPFLWKHVWW